MQFKQASSARSALFAHLPAARSVRHWLVALGASLFLSPAWADTAQRLASVPTLTTLTRVLPAWGGLPNSMVRVVYFRDASDGDRASPATRVYVNGRFHTALSAGNYTVFCLPAGLHTLSSLDNPIASYAGGASLTPAQMLAGGNTYVVQTASTQLAYRPDDAVARTVEVASRQAGGYSPVHSRLLSRAQTIACPLQQALAQP